MSGMDISGAYTSPIMRWQRQAEAGVAMEMVQDGTRPAKNALAAPTSDETENGYSATGKFASTLKARDSAALLEEFQKLSRMTEAEKIRARILEKHGQTEDTLRSLPEDEREAIENEIAEAIRQQYGLSEEEATAAGSAGSI